MIRPWLSEKELSLSAIAKFQLNCRYSVCKIHITLYSCLSRHEGTPDRDYKGRGKQQIFSAVDECSLRYPKRDNRIKSTASKHSQTFDGTSFVQTDAFQLTNGTVPLNLSALLMRCGTTECLTTMSSCGIPRLASPASTRPPGLYALVAGRLIAKSHTVECRNYHRCQAMGSICYLLLYAAAPQQNASLQS